MLLIAFLLNVAVTVAVSTLTILGSWRMEQVLGPDTPARRILVCLYLAIGVASLVGLVLIATGEGARARSIALTLFPLQIGYKLATVAVLGALQPVALSNLVISVVLLFALLR